uniref:Ankyrin n=1 Tax=Meloidogyne javanica TaxID=6303 RepID=A0A915MGC8_MELJA
MSNFFNKNNKVDRSFVNNFKALPFNPPNLNYHKMDICTAASIGDYALVQEYIQNDKDLVNYKNKHGWTPLMYASQAGNVEICKLLLDNGAILDVKNNKGKDAMHLASDWGHSSVIDMFKKN